MKLSPAHSAYLDFMRFFAALAVVLEHMQGDGFHLQWLPVTMFGHEAVVVFFVMSGFIIYTSTANRGADAATYVAARASRIYSVAAPALVFSFAVAAALGTWAPEFAAGIASHREFRWRDFFSSLLFYNESWSAWTGWYNVVPLNGPYWSLCYEVWYYVFFGIFFFVHSPWRWIALACALTVAGPAVVVMFPIWCMGAALAANGGKWPRPSPAVAWTLFIGSATLVIAVNMSEADKAVKAVMRNNVPGYWRLEYADRVVTDHLLGLAVMAHIYAFPSLGRKVVDGFARYRALWGALAGFSFTLYLFHRPISAVVGQWLTQSERHSGVLALVGVVGITMTCWLISFISERRLPQWRSFFAAVIARSAGVGSGRELSTSAQRRG